MELPLLLQKRIHRLRGLRGFEPQLQQPMEPPMNADGTATATATAKAGMIISGKHGKMGKSMGWGLRPIRESAPQFTTNHRTHT